MTQVSFLFSFFGSGTCTDYLQPAVLLRLISSQRRHLLHHLRLDRQHQRQHSHPQPLVQLPRLCSLNTSVRPSASIGMFCGRYTSMSPMPTLLHRQEHLGVMISCIFGEFHISLAIWCVLMVSALFSAVSVSFPMHCMSVHMPNISIWSLQPFGSSECGFTASIGKSGGLSLEVIWHLPSLWEVNTLEISAVCTVYQCQKHWISVPNSGTNLIIFATNNQCHRALLFSVNDTDFCLTYTLILSQNYINLHHSNHPLVHES